MTKYRMSDSDNAQLPIYTPQEEEKETPQKNKEEAEATVIPTKAKTTRKPKESEEHKTWNCNISWADWVCRDQQPLTHEPSLLYLNNETTSPDIL